MANNISLHEAYLDKLDEVYSRESLTSILDTEMIDSKINTSKKFKVDKMSLSGLGDYSRNTGYVAGDVTLTQEEVDPNYDRGRKFSVDVMDDQESGYVAFGKLSAEFERTKVIPEVDAFRFGKYATLAKTKVSANLTADTTMDAINTAEAAIINAEADLSNCVMFVSADVYGYMKIKAANRFGTWTDTVLDRNITSFDRMPLIVVPKGRFNDTITLGADGFTAAGKDINFLIVDKSAVMQFAKHRASNIISPDENQTADAYIMKYRMYGLADVYENKTGGIYAHTVA